MHLNRTVQPVHGFIKTITNAITLDLEPDFKCVSLDKTLHTCAIVCRLEQFQPTQWMTDSGLKA